MTLEGRKYETLPNPFIGYKVILVALAPWNISKNGKTSTFHLASNVTFHDGAPFNSKSVKWNIDHILSPDY